MSDVPLRTYPKPRYFAKMVVSFHKEQERTELWLKTGGFSFYGIPASDSPIGKAPLASAPADDWSFGVPTMGGTG